MMWIKRSTDLILSVLVLVLSAPILGMATAAVWATMGRPVIFRQQRIGLCGRPFTLFKLRTMRDTRGKNGVPLPDENRVTAVGRVLRRLRIDDLLQLAHVLTGEMSLVGPRPLPEKGQPREARLRNQRLSVLPGVTGWAQVNGNTGLSPDQKWALDVWYVTHRSFMLDFTILLRTLLVLLAGERINLNAIREADAYAHGPDRRSRQH